MNVDFNMPVQVITGENALRNHADKLVSLGKKALIVTGKGSAVRCGALADLTSIFNDRGIEWLVFNEVEPNPLLSTCKRAGMLGYKNNVDFVVGIGGGSPLDATKAIAIFAANNIEAEAVYNGWDKPALPFVLVGTTAGTGSEVTPYAVITVDRTGRKQTIRGQECYARYAFGDARYTMSLPYAFTVSTALDTLSHAIEGYFSTTSNELSDLFAGKAVEILVKLLTQIEGKHYYEITFPQREQLYNASILGGMTINRTGTCFCHVMGYFLTEEYQVAHGTACAVFLPAYIRRAAAYMPQKAEQLFRLAGTGQEELCELIVRMNAFDRIHLTPQQIQGHVSRWGDAKNFRHSPGNFSSADADQLMKELFA